MTPEEVEARFQRIEGLLMQTAELALKNQQQLDRLTAAQLATQGQVDELTRDFRDSIEDMMQFTTQTLSLAAENSNYIRGLQLENRRILRELRDRGGDDD